ncbi:MAG TPA: DinB family protein [Chitinophagaceae bacterium]|nr:DinB family protein [Chitinophagaceae bacterium]
MAQTQSVPVMTSEALLDHWQGHRRLTRKMIEAFPEDKLFTYSIGGMRPFAHLVFEFLDMTIPGLNGVVTGIWPGAEASFQRDRSNYPQTRADLLAAWDETTDEINKLWNKIPVERFLQVDKAFGQWEMPIYTTILYWIDNEIHHRGQAYVYLRSLGIEPPAFWDRS